MHYFFFPFFVVVNLDHNLGLKVTPKVVEVQGENGLSPGGSEGAQEEEEETPDDGSIKVVRAVYAFSGSSEDEVCGTGVVR